MTKPETELAATEASELFARALGISKVERSIETIGGRRFLKLHVGRRAPVYAKALRDLQKQLPPSNPFRGLINLKIVPYDRFPESPEADVLLGLLASTRTVASTTGLESRVPYVPFQNNEDQKVIKPATQLIVGRRGVGKSTLIVRALQLLSNSKTACAILDMQAYAQRTDEEVSNDVFADLARAIASALGGYAKLQNVAEKLTHFADAILNEPRVANVSAQLRRILLETTNQLSGLMVFLDDYHLVDPSIQPMLLQAIHGALKGAGGWLKVAGVRTLLNYYDPKTRTGLQVPGDAQLISLDLTLVDPKAAQTHIRSILETFLTTIGVEHVEEVIADNAFRRLVWANAGVPRDFLQMFSRSLEHARRASRVRVALSDTNLAIGEFGQQKMSELEQDARNSGDTLRRVLDYIVGYCLAQKKVNAFLVRQVSSEDLRYVQTLSDLRLVHLLHQTITPHKAGERYEAYVLDYSLFTGFRRRPGVKEMLPGKSEQFRAAELRKIPALPKDFANTALSGA